MNTKREIEDIDEQALIHSIYERDNEHSFRDRNTIQTTPIETNTQTVQPESKHKQRKVSLEDYARTENRRPQTCFY
jgi:hypothetical protein